MSNAQRCDGKSGLIGGRCRLDHLHPGQHDSGSKQWSRGAFEQQVYEIAMGKIAQAKQAQADRAEVLRRHERGERL